MHLTNPVIVLCNCRQKSIFPVVCEEKKTVRYQFHAAQFVTCYGETKNWHLLVSRSLLASSFVARIKSWTVAISMLIWPFILAKLSHKNVATTDDVSLDNLTSHFVKKCRKPIPSFLKKLLALGIDYWLTLVTMSWPLHNDHVGNRYHLVSNRMTQHTGNDESLQYDDYGCDKAASTTLYVYSFSRQVF